MDHTYLYQIFNILIITFVANENKNFSLKLLSIYQNNFYNVILSNK